MQLAKIKQISPNKFKRIWEQTPPERRLYRFYPDTMSYTITLIHPFIKYTRTWFLEETGDKTVQIKRFVYDGRIGRMLFDRLYGEYFE